LKVRDIAGWLETWAPRQFAESYDNVGLLVGHADAEVTQVLVSLDCTEEVVIEAERTGSQMIVSHHPVIFGGLKRLNGSNDVERTVMRAIRSGIALYAIHTNLDNVSTGVNRTLAESLGCLSDSLQILRPKGEGLEKWSVFVPEAQGTLGTTTNAVSRRRASARFGPWKAPTRTWGSWGNCTMSQKSSSRWRCLLRWPAPWKRP